MTTNGREWKFRNRVKKMLAEKIDGDPKAFTKSQKKLSYNLNSVKTSAGVSKPEEIVLTDDEALNNVLLNSHGMKSRRKLKLEKKKNRTDFKSDSKLINDFNEETKDKREKKRRVDTAKNRRQDYSVKKKLKKNSKEKRFQLKTSIPESPSIHNDEFDSDDHDVVPLLTEDNNQRNDEGTELLEKRIKFGEPTIIAGTPKGVSKLSLFSSPVLNSNQSPTVSNSRGNVLSNFISDDEDPNFVMFHNHPVMVANEIDDHRIAGTDDAEEKDTELFYENLENPDEDSDISFISNEDKSDSNSCQNKTNDNFTPILASEYWMESENDTMKKPEFYSLHNKVVAMMGPSCKFYFNGKLRVKVLIGQVEIYGFVFTRSTTVVPAEIYSPRGSSLISIKTVNQESVDQTSEESLYSLLLNEGINEGVATEMESKLKELPGGHAVLVLENLENTLSKYLDFYYPLKLFPKIDDPTNYHNRHPKKAEKLLQAVIRHDDLGKQLKKDNYREANILSKLLNPLTQSRGQRILISGGKGVGKSTTLRYFVNGLLPTHREIVVIDFDPGQPEFTPPGCISLNIIDRPLTGPNYTHLKTPFYQIYIGDVNVARCVPRYVKAAKKLVEYLNESPRLQDRPVLINTMGFCTGIGWDLMVYIIKLVHPSTVIQISSERSKNNFHYLLSSEVINDQSPIRFTGGESENSVWEVSCDHELHVVPSLAEGKGKFGDFWEMEPRQQRDISLLAYLSKIPKESEGDGNLTLSSLPRINDTVPYSVPMSKLTISLIRTIVPASHILATMNGNIVALCGIDDTDEVPDSHEAADFYPKTLLRAPISPCYGFGIVRGIDMETGKVFINTPLSIAELKHVNSLIGSIPLPTSLILSDRRNAPYIGEGADLPTSREPRRGYFRMRQRNRKT